VDLNYSAVQPVEVGGVLCPRLRLKEVYAVYTGQFRRWFAITAPTSLLSAATLLLADRKIREIYRSFPVTQITQHSADLAAAGVVRYGSFLISWFFGCFALAAVATVANRLNRSENEDVWISDSFQRARECFRSLFLLAFVTFGVYLVGMAAVGFVIFAFARLVGWAHFARFNYAASLLGVVIIASIVSWFGMAIPLILAEDIATWAALKKSLKLSNGYEFFLSLLVCESLIGSYAAFYAVRYGLALLFPIQLQYATWYGWLVNLVTILASAAVQPPMFIGFSLLAAEELPDSSSLPRSQQSAHVD